MFDNEQVSNYLEELYSLLVKRYPGKTFLLITDNCSAHETPKCMKILSDILLKVLFIPSYSPEYNGNVMFYLNH